jgi:hypothetical protein
VGVDHCGLHVAVAEKLLDRPNVVIGLQKMGCKTVAEGIRSDTLCNFSPAYSPVKRILYMSFVQMISPQFLCRRNRRECILRKKPLPGEILRSGGRFLFEQVVEKN